MKRLLLFTAFTILFSVTLNAQWEKVTNLPAADWNQAGLLQASGGNVTFTAGFDGSDPLLFHSTDNGASWVTQTIPTFGTCASFSSENSFFLSVSGMIYRSTDLGVSWDTVFSEFYVTQFLDDMKMFDEMNGVAFGDAINQTLPSAVLRTTDGGLSWERINGDYLFGNFNCLHQIMSFPSVSVGYIKQNPGSTLAKTTDSGATWNPVTTPITPIDAVEFYDDLHGIAVDPYTQQLIATTDGGTTWSTHSTLMNSHVLSIRYVPGHPDLIWAVTNSNNMYFSQDGGATWVEDELTRFNDVNIERLSISANGTGWIITSDGTLYKNNDATVLSAEEGTVPAEFSLEQNFPNPFNPSTTIRYALPQAETVTLAVFNSLGQETARLIDNAFTPAGTYDAVFNAANLPTGVYLCRLTAGNVQFTQKMLLVK